MSLESRMDHLNYSQPWNASIPAAATWSRTNLQVCDRGRDRNVERVGELGEP